LFEKEAPNSGKSTKSKQRVETGTHMGAPLQLWGKSPWLQSVIVDVENEDRAKKFLGKITNVKILKARPSSLVGEIEFNF
jgi:tRNA A37 methylthiotransferase MiaB